MLAIRSAALAIVVFMLHMPPGAGASNGSQPTSWVRQFGTSGLDEAKSVAVDATGAAYVVGETFGTLPGQTPAGTLDAFIRKYDLSGAELWTRQFGAWDRDIAWAVAVAPEGHVYVVGQTEGTFPGQHSAGGLDAFVRKYDASGSELWTRQFGGGGADVAASVAVDDAGDVYVAGSAGGALSGRTSSGGATAFLRQYDPTGAALWTDQFDNGAADDAWDVAVGGVEQAYLVGATERVLPGQRASGRVDAFVRRYGPGGHTVWTHQYGTPEDDYGLALAVDPERGVVIAGSTRGTLDGRAHGNLDAYALRHVVASSQ